MAARGAAVVNGEGSNARKKITKYHVKETRKGPRVGDGRAARSRHNRHVINGLPAVSKKTNLARERVEERGRREGHSHN